jgi:hypothetical protein
MDSIQPLLLKHCGSCHGHQKQTNQFDVRSVASLHRGGKRGAAIVPGDSASSLLYQVLQPGAKPHMPPGEKQLNDEEISQVQRWIDGLTALEISEESAPPGTNSDERHVAQSDTAWLPPPGINPTVVIDLLIEQAWNRDHLQPIARCDDGAFARRLYLDLLGRIPTPDEFAEFQQDTASDKRQRLIDQLLADPHWGRHMAQLFDATLMGRPRRDADRQRAENGWLDYLETSFRENRPWDQVVQEILLARPTDESQRGATWFLYERRDNYQEIAEAIAPVFFGVQIQCAQCHDHPLAAEIEQRHYWGLVAFFNRGKNARSKLGPQVSESAVGGYAQFTDLSGASHDNLLVFLDRPVVEEQRPESDQKEADSDDRYFALEAEDGTAVDAPRVPRFSRRAEFVQRIVDDHPRLARAMVNRIWASLLGRGLVHPVDKMDSAHPPSHPALLDWLSDDFRRSHYDVRRLVRHIAHSRVYQLDSCRPDEAVDPASFSYGLQKPLIAEVYLRSMLMAAGRTPDEMEELLPAFRNRFGDVFPEESITTLDQALLLSNHPELLQAIYPSADGFGEPSYADDGLLAQLLDLPDRATQVQALFGRVFHRSPDADERQRAVSYLEEYSSDPSQSLANLLWAMLTSAEFRFNH